MRLILLILMPLRLVWAEENALEELSQKCENALDRAKQDVADYQRSIMYNTLPSAVAVDAASNQPILTGNPILDQFTQMNQTNQRMAQLKLQESQAIAEAEDDCFNQFEQNNDDVEKNRRKGYEGLEEIARAENEKQKQINQIRTSCLTKSMELAQQERLRILTTYDQRLVSTVGGVTQSRKQLDNLPTFFNQQCLNAAKYALESAEQELSTTMRVYNIRTQEIMSTNDYLDLKKSRLSAYCEQRYDRITQQARDQKNLLAQEQLLMLIGSQMALRTASANGETQQRVYGVAQSLTDLLQPTAWNNLRQICANQFQESGTVRVPADVFGSFADVNKYCRQPNAPQNLNCVTTHGAESLERRRQRGGAAPGIVN